MEKTAFAPIATLRERLMLIAKALMPLAPMALAVLWLKRVAKDSQFVLCHPYGAEIVLYGFLALTPLSMTAIMVMIHGRFASSILRHRQFPPPGHKTFSRTRYRHGWRAVALGWLIVVLISCVFAVSLYSAWLAHEWMSRLNHDAMRMEQEKACPKRG